MNKYSDYMFRETTKKFIELEGFVNPTKIQKEVIPFACKGKSIVGVSATGSGKTHAFLIPIMEIIDTSIDQVQAVISAPTRELAMQIYFRAQKMNEANPDLNIRLIVGGKEKSKMVNSLKKQPHLVIGTPGRIKDLFLNEQALRVESAKIFVVDEADMTLEMGFLEDVDAIAGRMNRNLQMMSFSATIPQALQQFLKKYMSDPKIIRIEDANKFQPKIDHILIPTNNKTYEEKLIELLPCIKPYVCLIFANTRVEVAKTAQLMRDEGYDVIELHGDLSSRERMKSMKELQQLNKTFVVASDIAARGIDIDGVSHVISLGFPKELDYYIHRSGRTGRAGKDGICYCLYQKSDDQAIRTLEKRGISFKHQALRNGEFRDLEAIHKKKVRKDDPLEKEIAKIVSKKNKKVKPGYKKKQQAQVEKLKRKARRQMIQNDIQLQKKERAKAKQRELNGEYDD